MLCLFFCVFSKLAYIIGLQNICHYAVALYTRYILYKYNKECVATLKMIPLKKDNSVQKVEKVVEKTTKKLY